MPSYTKVANGNISPSRFVILGSGDKVTQASAATTRLYGISGMGTRNTPLSPLDDGYHAIADENCMIYGPPEKDVILELGGTVTAGASLTSDASGKGVATTAGTDFVGAVAMEAGVSGDLIRVQVVAGNLY